MRIFTDEENLILSNYAYYCSLHSTSRQQFRKSIITPYNKINKTNKLCSYHLLERDYPTLVKYLLDEYKLTNIKDLFEDNFYKEVNNLHLLPTAKSYSSISVYYRTIDYTQIIDAYRLSNKTLINKITNEAFQYDGNKNEFISVTNPNHTLHPYYISDFLYLFNEG